MPGFPWGAKHFSRREYSLLSWQRGHWGFPDEWHTPAGPRRPTEPHVDCSTMTIFLKSMPKKVLNGRPTPHQNVWQSVGEYWFKAFFFCATELLSLIQFLSNNWWIRIEMYSTRLRKPFLQTGFNSVWLEYMQAHACKQKEKEMSLLNSLSVNAFVPFIAHTSS